MKTSYILKHQNSVEHRKHMEYYIFDLEDSILNIIKVTLTQRQQQITLTSSEHQCGKYINCTD